MMMKEPNDLHNKWDPKTLVGLGFAILTFLYNLGLFIYAIILMVQVLTSHEAISIFDIACFSTSIIFPCYAIVIMPYTSYNFDYKQALITYECLIYTYIEGAVIVLLLIFYIPAFIFAFNPKNDPSGIIKEMLLLWSIIDLLNCAFFITTELLYYFTYKPKLPPPSICEYNSLTQI